MSSQPSTEEVLRRLLRAHHHADVGAWELDVRTGAVWWSPHLYTMMRRDPASPPPTAEEAEALHHPDDLPCLRSLDLLTPHDGPITFEHRTHPDLGPVRRLRCIVEQRRDEGGAVTHLLGTMVDITALHATEEQLRATNATLSLVLDQAPYFIFVMRRDGSIEYINRARPGYDAAQIMRDGTAYVQPASLPDVLAALQVTFERHERPVVEFDDIFGRRFEATIIPVLHGETVEKAIGFAIETTELHQSHVERQRLEAQLQHAQKLESLGLLAGGIAHDFNNILSAILGHAELAAAQRSDPTAALQEIIGAAERATLLCQQLLAYSGRGHLQARRVELGQVLAEITSLLRVSVSRRIKLHLELAPELPPVYADPSQLQQIAMNLITNAAEAIGSGEGEIRLRTLSGWREREELAATWLDDKLPAGDYVTLEVRDSGAGMTPALCAQIFDPFFSSKGPGRGLGLAAVLGIVRKHRGAIEVLSAPGEGTCFRVLLPAAPARVEDAAPEPPPSALPPRQARGTLLIADDEDALRRMLTEALQAQGYTVLTAPDGAAAVELFKAHHAQLDAALLDLTMPHLDGAAALYQLRQVDPAVPVALMSGYTSQEASTLLQHLQADAFLQKPFRLRDLLDTLESLIAQRPR